MKVLRLLLFFIAIACMEHACSPKTSPEIAVTPIPNYKGPLIRYSIDVQPILERSCSPCHFPSLGGDRQPLDSFRAVKSTAAEILKRIQLPHDKRAFMPFKLAQEPLSQKEIEVIRNWVLGAYKM
ncbi:MAG: hypothetical protein U5L96_01575 [Owenweeksia sp.]|nr:hypothetical protein [Owenweeksia sp.]